MISKMLRRARDFENKNLPYTEKEMTKFHETGSNVWINDPNDFAT